VATDRLVFRLWPNSPQHRDEVVTHALAPGATAVES